MPQWPRGHNGRPVGAPGANRPRCHWASWQPDGAQPHLTSPSAPSVSLSAPGPQRSAPQWPLFHNRECELGKGVKSCARLCRSQARVSPRLPHNPGCVLYCGRYCGFYSVPICGALQCGVPVWSSTVEFQRAAGLQCIALWTLLQNVCRLSSMSQ